MANDSIEAEIFKLLLEDLNASKEFGEAAAEKVNRLIKDNLLTDTEAILDSIRSANHEVD